MDQGLPSRQGPRISSSPTSTSKGRGKQAAPCAPSHFLSLKMKPWPCTALTSLFQIADSSSQASCFYLLSIFSSVFFMTSHPPSFYWLLHKNAKSDINSQPQNWRSREKDIRGKISRAEPTTEPSTGLVLSRLWTLSQVWAANHYLKESLAPFFLLLLPARVALPVWKTALFSWSLPTNFL